MGAKIQVWMKSSKPSKATLLKTDQAKKLELARGHLEYLDDMITQTEVELYVRIKPYYKFVEFVSTIARHDRVKFHDCSCRNRRDMDIFDDAKHLCPGADFLLPTMNLLVRKSLSALPKQAIT